MVNLILQSPALTDLFKRFTENKLFKACQSGDGPWEHRLGATPDALGASPDALRATPDALGAIEDSIPNRLSLLLATYSRFKDLQVELRRT